MGTKSDIEQYASAFAAALPVDSPGPSDCYFCLIRDERGTPLGDALGDYDHLRLHVNERYIFGSLLQNAIEAVGASVAVQQSIFRGSSPYTADQLPSEHCHEIQRILTQYLEERLTPEVVRAYDAEARRARLSNPQRCGRISL